MTAQPVESPNVINTPVLNTPVLVIVFNRADTAEKVMDEIAKAKPAKLYIAADGPRPSRPQEAALCEETRQAVLAKITWPCEVKTRFLEENLGCDNAVRSAINWLFEHEDRGIILEDDCIPHTDFFTFCDTLLTRYEHDTRVMHISGFNCFNKRYGDGSYFMMRQPLIWGWATWKRTWDKYDFNMTTFPQYKKLQMQDSFFDNWLVKKLRTMQWEKIYAKPEHKKVWDFPYSYFIMSEAGLCVTPNVNLVSNIGFGTNATHQTLAWDSHADKATAGLNNTLVPPTFMTPIAEADRYKLRHLNKYSIRGVLWTVFTKITLKLIKR
jgi:hypothetical protein